MNSVFGGGEHDHSPSHRLTNNKLFMQTLPREKKAVNKKDD